LGRISLDSYHSEAGLSQTEPDRSQRVFFDVIYRALACFTGFFACYRNVIYRVFLLFNVIYRYFFQDRS